MKYINLIIALKWVWVVIIAMFILLSLGLSSCATTTQFTEGYVKAKKAEGIAFNEDKSKGLVQAWDIDIPGYGFLRFPSDYYEQGDCLDAFYDAKGGFIAGFRKKDGCKYVILFKTPGQFWEAFVPSDGCDLAYRNVIIFEQGVSADPEGSLLATAYIGTQKHSFTRRISHVYGRKLW